MTETYITQRALINMRDKNKWQKHWQAFKTSQAFNYNNGQSERNLNKSLRFMQCLVYPYNGSKIFKNHFI